MHAKTVSQNKITNDTLILMMALFYPAIHNYIWSVLIGITRNIGFSFTIEVFDAIVWLFVIGYILLTSHKPSIHFKVLIFSLSVIIIILFSYMLTAYEYFSVSVLLSLLIGFILFFLQGSFIDFKRVSHKQLYIVAIFTLIVSMIYSMYFVSSKKINLEDNMDFAYKILPAVLIIFSWLFMAEKKIWAALLSGIATIFLLLQGTRGPLLCVAFFVVLMMYKKKDNVKAILKMGAVVLAVALVITLPIVQSTLISLTEKIDSSGYSSRFITMMLEGELSDGNGRDAIKETLLKEIKENPFLIRGMFSDRQATRGLVDSEYNTIYEKGTYAHSLWIEMMYDWGVFLGGILLIALFLAVLKLIQKSDREDSYLIMLFICTGFVYLFLSGSYLQSTDFFFLIGLLISYHKKSATSHKQESL